MASLAALEVMDIGTMLNNKAVQHHFNGPFDHHSHFSFIKSEPGMERSVSPHGSEHSHYSGHMPRSYGSPSAMQAPMPLNGMQTQMPLPSFPDMSGMTNVHGMHTLQHMQHPQAPPPPPQHQQPQQPQQQARAPPAATKSYPCSTCGKHFARRSDLARHERIHTGVRPHVCDTCGKMFIQRSALTVHQRVHTGEKPHHCEICAKRFSDSSSLARHRRTHLGMRPYKCPYAYCQKTFTRRTTLNRHQKHHTGTIEDARLATKMALAESKGPQGRPIGQAASEGDQMSSHGSPVSTPSPAQRTMSMSPSVDLSGAGMPRQNGDLQYLQQNGSLPVHLRVGSPVAATTSAGYANALRPTSHPTGYGPPSTLEPSVDQHQQQGPGSAGGSPHMSSVGWQSPSHMASPTSQNGNSYVYTDPNDGYANSAAMNQMYYGAAPQMRRPQSAEPGLVHMA